MSRMTATVQAEDEDPRREAMRHLDKAIEALDRAWRERPPEEGQILRHIHRSAERTSMRLYMVMQRKPL